MTERFHVSPLPLLTVLVSSHTFIPITLPAVRDVSVKGPSAATVWVTTRLTVAVQSAVRARITTPPCSTIIATCSAIAILTFATSVGVSNSSVPTLAIRALRCAATPITYPGYSGIGRMTLTQGALIGISTPKMLRVGGSLILALIAANLQLIQLAAELTHIDANPSRSLIVVREP